MPQSRTPLFGVDLLSWSVVDLSTALGVSPRVLRRVCQQQLGVGPHRLLWLCRMALAREALLQASAPTGRVTDIAMRFGFTELGQFSVNYRGVYGENPSATLRRPPAKSKAG